MTDNNINFSGNISDIMQSAYIDYSMSVIVSRALPDVRDGFKPVHRRVLYAMLREGLLHNRAYDKCAGVVGEVLKNYHPHGDSSVYDTLVRMAQPWVMRYPLVDGQGNFGAQQIISTDADEAISIYPSDIDNDGDIDVLSASTRDDKIAWYENTDGLGNFSSQKIITTNADGAKYVFAVDIDGDGDSDVLSASAFDNKIAWYENTDGQGNFSSQQIISTTTEFAKFVYSADLDNDGDKDVLAAAFGENKVTWFENTDGLGNFGTEQIITTETINPNSVFATDLNGDDSVDVLYASQTDDKIAWQENMGTLSINQNKVLAFSAYPVPVENILTLNSKNIITQVEIYNVFGQHYSLSFDQNKIDMSKLTQGMYLIKIINANGDYGIKKILKK